MSQRTGQGHVRLELEQDGEMVRGLWTYVTSVTDLGTPRQVLGELIGDTLVVRDLERRVLLLEGVIRGDELDARVPGAGRMRGVADVGARLRGESTRLQLRREGK